MHIPSSFSCQALLSATLLPLWWRELLCRDEDIVLILDGVVRKTLQKGGSLQTGVGRLGAK